MIDESERTFKQKEKRRVKWKEIWKFNTSFDFDEREWLLDTSGIDKDILNNLEDIIIEYLYHIEEDQP